MTEFFVVFGRGTVRRLLSCWVQGSIFDPLLLRFFFPLKRSKQKMSFERGKDSYLKFSFSPPHEGTPIQQCSRYIYFRHRRKIETLAKFPPLLVDERGSPKNCFSSSSASSSLSPGLFSSFLLLVTLSLQTGSLQR